MAKSKFKKATAVLLSGIMALSALSALPVTAGAAETSAEEVGYYYTSGYKYSLLDDGTAEITYYTGSATELEIPSTLGGYKVTSIGDEAFSGCNSLTSVTIPDSVTSIGDRAFEGCSSLTSITIPDSVTSIGDNAFCVCDSLTSITIPDSVTSIGEGAFHLCDSLASITIPNSVTSIGNVAFAWCDSLTSITIPKSVEKIGKRAFGYDWDDKNRENVKIDDFTIYGYTGTAAETYANENGFTFVALGEATEPTTPTEPTTTEPTTEPTTKPTTPATTDPQMGDVSGDGTVDISDATAIQKAVAQITSLTESQQKTADVNGDGNIDITDATMIQKFVAKIITSFTAAK